MGSSFGKPERSGIGVVLRDRDVNLFLFSRTSKAV